jgi:hypothetical protein
MPGRVLTRTIDGYDAGVTRLERLTDRPMSSGRGLATAWQRTLPALVAAVAVALVAAAPALSGDRAAPPPKNHLNPLWKQFPLKQSTTKRQSRTITTTTTPAPHTSRAKVRGEQAPRDAGTNRMWAIIAALIAACALAAVAWKRTRRGRSKRPAPSPPERARGLDLLDPAPPNAPAPLRTTPPQEPLPQVRASTTVAVTRLIETHLNGRSNAVRLHGRDEPAANGNPDAVRSEMALLLEAAQDAADEIRVSAKQEAEDIRVAAERYGEEVRRRADAAAADKRAAVDGDITRIIQAAEQRARQIEESAREHRKNLAAESQALEQLLADRRRWLREMMVAFRDVTNRLEDVTSALPPGEEDAPSSRDDAQGHARTAEGVQSPV